jgi:hypothetical protein
MSSSEATSSSRSFLYSSVRRFFGQGSLILADEHHQIFGDPVRHFDRVHDAMDRLVVPAQIIDFAGQIVLDSAGDARIEKFDRLRARA